MEMRIEVTGARELAQRYRGASQVLTDELSKGMLRLVIAGEAISKREAPKWRGQLARSITHRVSPAAGAVTGEWGTSLSYARYQELGTRRHFVSAANIGAWAQAHGFGNTGLIVSGKAHPFIRPAFNQIRPKVGPEMRAAVSRALARIRGGG